MPTPTSTALAIRPGANLAPPTSPAPAQPHSSALARAGGALRVALIRRPGPQAPPSPASAAAPAVSVARLAETHLPVIANNYALSAFDNTRIGQAIGQVVGAKPSTIAMAVSALIVLVAPRSWRKTRSRASVFGTGATNAVAARAGAATPAAVLQAFTGAPSAPEAATASAEAATEV